MKTTAKTKELKLGFLSWFMCMHEQPCMRIKDYAHMGFCPKTLKTQQRFKTLNLTS